MAKRSSRFRKWVERARGMVDENAVIFGCQHTKLQRCVHFWALVWRSFTRNRCPMRATALAYGTLLALIPVLAVVVSVTSSLVKNQGEERIDQFIDKMVSSIVPGVAASPNAPPTTAANNAETNLTSTASERSRTNSGQSGTGNSPYFSATGSTDANAPTNAYAQAQELEHVRHAVSRQIHEFVHNIRSGALGLTGSVLLIFVGISLLTEIETTFNDIWGASRGRSWITRVALYWGVLSLAPLLLVVAFGLATGPHLDWTRHLFAGTPFLTKVTFHILPVLVLWLTFSLFYGLMPNTRVDWRAALVGGLAGALLIHLNNQASVLYVGKVVKNSRVYGSLGLVPVLMMGLYFSWWILLFGAQVAYAFQNRHAYLEEKQVEAVNQRGREFVALRLMTWIGERFARGERQPGLVEMAQSLSVPTRLAQQILQTLCAARLVVETTGADAGYMPGRPLEMITCHDVLLAMRASQGQELATRDGPARVEVYGEYQRIEEAERLAASGVTLLALVQRAAGKELTAGNQGAGLVG